MTIFGTNIPDPSGHQMAIQVPAICLRDSVEYTQSSAATTRPRQSAWKLINIDILKLWRSAHWSAAADER